MSVNEIPVNPRELVRQFRQNYVNAHALNKKTPQALAGASIYTPKEKPIQEGDLPQELRSLLRDVRNEHPRSKVTVLKYQKIKNGKPTEVIEDDSPLPDEDKLLTLSQTVTLTTSRDVRVITHILVASIETV